MKVRIARTPGVKTTFVRDVLDELIKYPGPIQFIEVQRALLFKQVDFAWDDIFNETNELRNLTNIPQDEFIFVLTELTNKEYWFSAFAQNGDKNFFIQTSEWENYIYCEPVYPVVYEIFANLFQYHLYHGLDNDIDKFVHFTTIGCMNDMCDWKPDITYKLRTGDICENCIALVKQFATQEQLDQAIRAFEGTRRKMLFSNQLQSNLSFEHYLPFSIAITKRKMSTSLDSFKKLLLLIDHFDSLIRTTTLSLACLNLHSSEVITFLKFHSLDQLPSLGNWVNALAAIASSSRDAMESLTLPRDFSSKVQHVVQISNENNIMQIRNEQRGHGYLHCHSNDYQRAFKECMPVIEEIEKLLLPLYLKFQFFHIISSRRIRDNLFKITYFDLAGSNPTFPECEIEAKYNDVNEIPIEDSIYLVSGDRKLWIPMSPYIKFTKCPACDHIRFLIFDGIYMLDPYIGHRFKAEGY